MTHFRTMNIKYLKSTQQRFGTSGLMKFMFAYYLYRIFKLRTYCFHSLPAEKSLFSGFKKPLNDATDFIFKEIQPSELLPYVTDPVYELSVSFIAQIQKEQHRCFACFHKEKIIAYSFFSSSATKVGSQISVQFPPHWIYVYKVLAHPEYRGKKISAELIKTAFNEYKNSQQFQGFITFIYTDNPSSLQAFKHMGFKLICNFTIIDRLPTPILLNSRVNFGGAELALKQII
jgi:GNAT superfamily N-acetyltransferase